jgi:hypothetical protein
VIEFIGTFDPPAFYFMLHTVMELQRSNGALVQAIQGLSAAIEKQGGKLGGIDDMRVDVVRGNG